MSTAPERARLSLDLDDDEDIESQDAIRQKIEEISNESGFAAKAPQRKASVKKTAANEPAPPKRKPRRRPKTGRTYPFNTKIKPETYDKICTLADEATEAEGRVVSMAEIIERGIDLLEQQDV